MWPRRLFPVSPRDFYLRRVKWEQDENELAAQPADRR